MFPSGDPWEIALWIVAAYLVVVALARLAVYERDRRVARIRGQIQSQRKEQAETILARRHAARPTTRSRDVSR
jgi:hypothetical protein